MSETMRTQFSVDIPVHKSTDTEAVTPPVAWVLCSDERMVRFFEIELAHLGLATMIEPDAERVPCMAIVNTDEYAIEPLLSTLLPPDCPVVAFGRASVTLPEGMPQGRGLYLRRPFALTALERALRQLTVGASSTAAPLMVTPAVSPVVETASTEPTLEVTDETATINGQTLALTPAEFVLLRRLYQSRGEVVARDELAALLGGAGTA